MPEPQIATDPHGIVHNLADDHMTVCGRNADGWSRAVTIPYLAGLYIGCGDCDA